MDYEGEDSNFSPGRCFTLDLVFFFASLHNAVLAWYYVCSCQMHVETLLRSCCFQESQQKN